MFSKHTVFVVLSTTLLVVVQSFAVNSVNNVKSVFVTRKSIRESLNSLTPDLTHSINNGAQLAMDQCQEVFKWNRWNCPETSFSRKYQHSATKEQAFAKAIMAAGIAHTITRNCSRGSIKGCGCNPKLGDQQPLVSGREIDPAEFNETELKGQRVSWSWGGCSDDVDFGNRMSQEFFQQMEVNATPEYSVHAHNARVGREIVKQTMLKRCRCHGVSGSCTLQTCWMQVAPFAQIASILKQKYDTAKILNETLDISNSATVSPTPRILPTAPDSLVYVNPSPDYCMANVTLGWRGNKGRVCSRTKLESASFAEKKSCRNVCRACGLRVRKRKKVVKSRCNCSFKWCCEVKCETCVKTVTEFYCD